MSKKLTLSLDDSIKVRKLIEDLDSDSLVKRNDQDLVTLRGLESRLLSLGSFEVTDQEFTELENLAIESDDPLLLYTLSGQITGKYLLAKQMKEITDMENKAKRLFDDKFFYRSIEDCLDGHPELLELLDVYSEEYLNRIQSMRELLLEFFVDGFMTAKEQK